MPAIRKRLGPAKDMILSYFVESHRYDYWHCPHRRSTLIEKGDYFIDFRPKLDYEGPRDAEGVPLLDLSSVPSSRGVETVYSPVMVSQYALGLYSCYLVDGNPDYLAQFLTMADSLVANTERFEHQAGAVAICPMEFGRGKTRSGMAQGQAISVWRRAFRGD